MANMKRIHKVVIKRMVDESPDTSWGEYSNKQTSEFSIDRAHDLDCVVNTHAGEHDPDTHECKYLGNDAWSCGHIDQSDCCSQNGQWDSREYRYFNPSFNYVDAQGKMLPENSASEVRKYVAQDYERMESLNRGDWSFIGIRAEAEYSVGGQVAPVQTISSGGLWGIESDSDESYFAEVEAEELSGLREQLHAIGFSKRAITAAFKNVEKESR